MDTSLDIQDKTIRVQETSSQFTYTGKTKR